MINEDADSAVFYQNADWSIMLFNNISRSENNQQNIIDARIDRFLSAYEEQARHFSRRLIWNMDQTPIQYEHASKRTISFIGEKNTKARVDSKNKLTHSITAQPMISRDGSTIGKLLLVMQEAQNGFGPRVAETVSNLERQYGNVRVLATTSGKLTGELIRQWLREVLHPAIRDHLDSLDTDTELDTDFETLSIDDEAFGEPGLSANESISPALNSSDRHAFEQTYLKPHTMLIADSWIYTAFGCRIQHAI